MATTAAVLQVMVDANTTLATTKLTKFDKQFEAVNRETKKGIEVRLDGNFNREAFTQYEKALSTASRRAKDREAFKAELGANFNNRAFNEYERALRKAETTTKTTTSHTSMLSGAIGGASSKALGAASAFAGVSVGATFIGKASIDAATNFQQAMLLIHTQAGYAEGDVKRLSKSVLALAPSVGFGPQNLATALFHVASAGIPASKAMGTLKAAAKGARVGNADLEQTTNALVGVLKTAPKDIKGAKDAMGTLSAIVGQGNLRMNDLTSALGTGVLPSAKAFGLGLKDVGGALDVMTARGIPAVAAATRLRQTFSLMENPTTKAKTALKSIGLSSTQLAEDMRKPHGLVVAVGDLRKHLDDSGMSATKQAQVIGNAFGGGRTSSGILTLVQNVGDLKKRTDDLSNQKGTKTLDDAFKKTQQDGASNMDRFKASIQTIEIALGSALLPVVKILSTAAQAVAHFVDQMRTGKGAGGEFARVMSDVFGTVKDIVVTTVDIIKKVFNALKDAFKAVQSVAKTVLGALEDAFRTTARIVKPLIQGIGDVFQGTMKIIRGVIKVFSGLFKGDFSDMWKGIKGIFSGALQDVVGILKGFFGTFYNVGKALVGWIGKGFKDAFDFVVNTIIDFLNDIIDVLDKIPFVDIGKIGHIGGGGGGGGIGGSGGGTPGVGHGGTSTPGHQPGRHAKGGMVTIPGYFAGEEAPMHPEVILATNPAYRRRNLKLWAKAGGMLGVPGFQGGGVVSYAGLESLWAGAGGPKSLAPVAAAIAEAESGGNVRAYNSSGASGLWQILGVPFPGNVWDPATNARMAVSKWANASGGGHNFSPWTAYTSGAYKSFLQGHLFGGSVGSGILSALGGAAGAVLGLGADALKALLPSPPKLPDWISGLGPWMLKKAGSWIEDQVGSFFGGGGGGGPAAKGLVTDNGHLVAAWIEKILNYARNRGWAGSVSSGYRSYAEQKAIYDSGVRPAAVPGTSHHEGINYPSGAVDVTGAAQLSAILMRSPYAQTLLWAGSKDPVHFSHPFGGGYAKGGVFPYAGSFHQGGTVPHDGMALVQRGEQVIPSFKQGGIDYAARGYNILAAATVASRFPELLRSRLAGIPSQATDQQLQSAILANRLTLAQNAGNIPGQRRALGGQLKLEKQWLADDRAKLKTVNKLLRNKNLSRKNRADLIQDKLALIQEIGTVAGDIGTTTQSLADLTTADTGAGGDPNQPLIDALNAQAQAAADLKNALDTQTQYMQSIGEIEKRQAIKALADVISGQIGGQYISRATGSAGDGSIARYGSVARA